MYLLLKSSDKRDAGHGGDSACVVVVSPHLDVALVPPVLGPAVLHQPVVVVGVGVSPVAHSQHSVVQLAGAAVRVVVDTVVVKLEAVLAGVDGDGDGSQPGHGGLQSVLVTLLDVDEAVVNAADVVGTELAPVSVSGRVGVTCLL